MKPVLLFDLDGTLLDSLADITRCGNEALALSGLPLHTQKEYQGYIGNGARLLVQRMLAPKDRPAYEEQVYANYMRIYEGLCAQGCNPFPGVLDMLRTLQKAGFLTAVISNKPDSQTRLVWESTFGNTLDLAQGQLEGVPTKPDPAGPREVLRRLDGVCAAYIGDSEVDMQTGKNCGFYTIGVTWGMKPREMLLENGADALADSVEELAALLRLRLLKEE
ncbi:MAG: HAD hydrolase-like protein [Angelakisella sp.]|jgi:phosphoglycolate phosphatase|nr:HAD hydrolase-like protein [Angelakisella sp.]